MPCRFSSASTKASGPVRVYTQSGSDPSAAFQRVVLGADGSAELISFAAPEDAASDPLMETQRIDAAGAVVNKGPQ